jgi:hypothetical protein
MEAHMMEDLEYRRKDLIRGILDNPLWPSTVEMLKLDYAKRMLDARNGSDREDLYNESRAMSRALGKLTSIANEVRAINSKLEKSNG